MVNLCNLNGAILPEEKTQVSVLDRGFLFGDSIYEVLGTRRGVPFGIQEHLERLHASADALMLKMDVDDASLLRRIKQTLAAAKNDESYIRIIVTRGVGTAPNIDVAHAPGPCTVLVMIRSLPSLPGSEGNLAIVSRLRNDRRALDPAAKSGNYLNNVLGLIEAKQAGAGDALFVNAAGYLTEATTSNIWMVHQGGVYTPPLAAGILAGVTRRMLFDCCAEAGMLCAERDITPQQLLRADEVFITSTLRHVFPVTTLDGKPVRDGKPGEVTVQLATRFERYCEQRHQRNDLPAWSRI